MNTFIFDLDGTLLPMDQDSFLDVYFKALAAKVAPHGLEPKGFIKTIIAGLKSMIENDGSMTNENRFWKTVTGIQGKDLRNMEPVFLDFYKNEFNAARCATSVNKTAAQCIRLLKDKGYQIILATNPVFPSVATHNRIKWAGLNADDFELITTYENSSYCKPNLDYYKAILKLLKRKPEECIMVGNDINEDMCVSKIGMQTFLIKDCMINTTGEDIRGYRQGGFEELLEYIKSLPDLK